MENGLLVAIPLSSEVVAIANETVSIIDDYPVPADQIVGSIKLLLLQGHSLEITFILISNSNLKIEIYRIMSQNGSLWDFSSSQQQRVRVLA